MSSSSQGNVNASEPVRPTGHQRRQIREALVSGFTHESLKMFVRESLDEDLYHIAKRGNLNDVVTDLIAWAVRVGRVDDLVNQAYEANPGNPKLRKLHENYPTWKMEGGNGGPPPPSPGPELKWLLIPVVLLVIAGGIYWATQRPVEVAPPTPASVKMLESVDPDAVLTVRVVTAEGPLTSGEVRLIAGPETHRQPIDANGEADFKSVAREGVARVSVWHDGIRIHQEDLELSQVGEVVELSAALATPTPTPLPTPTRLPFPTARADEYMILVSEFYPPLPDFPEFDPLDEISDAVQDAIDKSSPPVVAEVAELAQSIVDDLSAHKIGLSANADTVIWGRISRGRIRTNITRPIRPVDTVISRFRGDPAEPENTFFDQAAPEQIKTYLAPFVMGLYYYDSADYASAEQMFSDAIDSVSEVELDGVETVQLYLSNALQLQGKFEEALEPLDAVSAARPNMEEVAYNRAWIYYLQGEQEAATEMLEDLLSFNSTYADGHLLLATLRSSQAAGEPDPEQQRALRLSAIDGFSKALELMSPEEAQLAYDIYSTRGLIHGRVGAYAEAYEDFLIALGPDEDCTPILNSEISQTAPNIADTLCAVAANNLATVYVEEMDASYEDAARLAQLAAERATNPFIKMASLDTLAHAYAKMGRGEEACRTIQEASSLIPDHPAIAASVEELCDGQ